jgi:hypothetical protein
MDGRVAPQPLHSLREAAGTESPRRGARAGVAGVIRRRRPDASPGGLERIPLPFSPAQVDEQGLGAADAVGAGEPEKRISRAP